MDPGRLAIDGLLIALLIGGTITDIRAGKVYNALTYTGAVAGLFLNALLHPAGIGLVAAALGLMTGFVPLFLIYLAGGLGGGDVKLMAMVGAFLGPEPTLYALLYTCLLGAALAIGLVIWKEGFSGVALRALIWRRQRLSEKDGFVAHRFPFALAILLGAAWVVGEHHLGTTLLDALRSGGA